MSFKTNSKISCSSRTLYLHFVFAVWITEGKPASASDRSGVQLMQPPKKRHQLDLKGIIAGGAV
jgi:hypothetical protein